MGLNPTSALKRWHTDKRTNTRTHEKWTVYTVYIYMMPVQKIKASKDIWRTETYIYLWIYILIGTVCYYWYVSMHGHFNTMSIVKVIVNDTDETGNKMSHPDVTPPSNYPPIHPSGPQGCVWRKMLVFRWSGQGRKWTGVCLIVVTCDPSFIIHHIKIFFLSFFLFFTNTNFTS